MRQRRHNEERCAELVDACGLVRDRTGAGAAAPGGAGSRTRRQPADSGFGGGDLASAQQEHGAEPAGGGRRGNGLAELEHQQEESRACIMEAVASASNLRNQLTQAEERLAALDREAQRLQAEMATANSQVEAFGGQRGQLALEFETVSQRVCGID